MKIQASSVLLLALLIMGLSAQSTSTSNCIGEQIGSTQNSNFCGQCNYCSADESVTVDCSPCSEYQFAPGSDHTLNKVTSGTSESGSVNFSSDTLNGFSNWCIKCSYSTTLESVDCEPCQSVSNFVTTMSTESVAGAEAT